MPATPHRTDLNLFRVFDAIYTEGSLTRAAEILHITQPAVSNALARLRETVDDPLFVRSAGGMQPTPLAQRWAVTVAPALAQLDRALQQEQRFDPLAGSHVFRIHASEQAEQTLIPALAIHLATVAPQVRLEVSFGARNDVPAAMARGDIALAIDAPMLNHPELISQPMYNDHYVCVVRQDHPLARSPISLERFLAYRHVHVSSRVRGAGHIDLALRALGKKRELAVRVQHYAALPAILQQTDLVGSVPAATAAHWGLHSCELPFDAPELVVQLFWHRSADADPANRWIRECVAQVMHSAATRPR